VVTGRKVDEDGTFWESKIKIYQYLSNLNGKKREKLKEKREFLCKTSF